MTSPDEDSQTTPGGDPDAPDLGPSPDSTESSLGLDDAWEQLSRGGRALVVGAAAALLMATAVGIGFGLGGSGDEGDGTLVLGETAGSVVTLEVPPATVTESVPTESTTPALPQTTTDPGVTSEEGVTSAEGATSDDAAPSGDPSAEAVQIFTDAGGPDIGTVSIAEPSEVTWTSEGTTFVLLDEASGATLVDSVDSQGAVALEVGEYDLRVEADAGWTVSVRPR